MPAVVFDDDLAVMNAMNKTGFSKKTDTEVVLALEQSSAMSSLALLRGSAVLREHAWTDSRAARQQAFDNIAGVLDCLPGGIESVGLLVVGLGPGAYTGLRTALVSMRVLALPDNRPVYGIPSPEVLAWELLETSAAPCVCVVGDARRGQIWCRSYVRDALLGVRPVEPEWNFGAIEELVPPPPGTLAATADLPRLAPLFNRWRETGVLLHQEPACATATALARLALLRAGGGVPSAPLAPIYLHGPVAPTPAHQK